MILCSRNKQNHKNKREKGLLNMNFAFDFKGVGVGWGGVGREGCRVGFVPPYILFFS
jgi:hypothetical protein